MLRAHGRSRVALPARRGFTMVEFLVVFTMLSLVGGTVTMLLLRQQRFYTNNSALLESRAQVRQVLNVVPIELWSVSPVGGDIYAMTDSSIDFRAVTGASMVCRVEGDAYLTLPPKQVAKAGTLTTWVNKPGIGDSLLVYDDSTSSATPEDDKWRAYEIKSVTERVGDIREGCPASSGYTQLTDLVSGNPAYQIVFTTKVSRTINSGAPVRIFRRVHYSLFKDTDGKWYLGYYDCVPLRTPVCTPIKAVSGPYLKYSHSGSPDKGGLIFTYYDSTGAATTDPKAVARINVVVRSSPEFAATDSYYQSSGFQDSLRFDVALRNRK